MVCYKLCMDQCQPWSNGLYLNQELRSIRVHHIMKTKQKT
uniref:Uncharacterized protein n=1 Tax=Rhizophora mucronata TaxID=61149 RepID=A0A2P2NC06_RHIMU